jgi:hypothetical protein
MSRHITPTTSLENLQREAKRWLKALRARDREARERFEAALTDAPVDPTLRDVQHALAREHALSGWAALRARVEAPPAVKRYHQVAEALVAAYASPDEPAMRIVWEYFGHRRTWDGMRRYVRLDLGKPEQPPDGDRITLTEAQSLVARAQGTETWEALVDAASLPAAGARAAKAIGVLRNQGERREQDALRSRDWDEVLEWLEDDTLTGVHASGQMTDALLARFAGVAHLTSLDLDSSPALTDDGVRHLARLPNLRHLNLSGCRSITDRGLEVLSQLPALESIELAWTACSNAGAAHLASCPRLKSVNLMGTFAGDGAIRALAGHQDLRDLRTGNAVTADGIAALSEIPAYGQWLGGSVRMELCGFDAQPNYLLLRGPFGDAGLANVARLEGLFALNVDDRHLGLTAAALPPLAALPHLNWLAFDAYDDAMPHIAALPHLRFLMCQDTPAGDVGFEALSRSRTLEYIWGRRCHNLQRRGFLALSTMPALRALSVSCLNVDDVGLASLPSFPALRELMPMDVADAGYRYIGRCTALESLVLMYCRETGDEATSHLTGLASLRSYFASYNRITDRTPELLSGLDSLERVVFDTCVGVTTNGVRALARLPSLREVSVGGMPLVTRDITTAFRPGVRVSWHP